MIFATALLAVYSLPHTDSVKVVIDGTIDFGPNWNFEYKVKPVSGFEPRKTVHKNHKVLRNNDNDVKTNNGIDADTAESNEFENRNFKGIATAQDSSYSDDDESNVRVTKLYKTKLRQEPLLKDPRKIQDEPEVVEFVAHIKNESIKMFDEVSEYFADDEALVKKIMELKERFIKKFDEFLNDTKNHTIRTALGIKRVVLNAINYSNRLIDRIVNRFKIDVENNTRGLEASKVLQEHADHLRKAEYNDACKMFGICRAGNEFSDHISEIITTLLEHNDDKVRTALLATAKALKSADFSRIMDNVTHTSFSKGLQSLEELSPFELRVLLMAYKLLIDNRHEPFTHNPKDVLVNATVALFHVMEGFNKKIIIDPNYWSNIKDDFYKWTEGAEGDVEKITKSLVDRVVSKISALDNNTASDFKEKLRLSTVVKSLRIDLKRFVQLQPFIN